MMGAAGIEEIRRRVDIHMSIAYKVSLADLEITDSPGYWQAKEERVHPGHPLHRCLGCEGPFKATYTYFDHYRVSGKFASPTRSWAALRKADV